MEDVWWLLSGGCLEGSYGMSEWYVGCIDDFEGQVRIGQVRTSRDR